jgi:hypothetical protein
MNGQTAGPLMSIPSESPSVSDEGWWRRENHIDYVQSFDMDRSIRAHSHGFIRSKSISTWHNSERLSASVIRHNSEPVLASVVKAATPEVAAKLRRRKSTLTALEMVTHITQIYEDTNARTHTNTHAHTHTHTHIHTIDKEAPLETHVHLYLRMLINCTHKSAHKCAYAHMQAANCTSTESKLLPLVQARSVQIFPLFFFFHS